MLGQIFQQDINHHRLRVPTKNRLVILCVSAKYLIGEDEIVTSDSVLFTIK